MLYFKNVELAKLHAVSEGTVRRWIEATRNGKLELQLYQQNGHFHVANTAKNKLLIKKLVSKGKKHGNARWHKLLTPKPEFYQLYSKRQIVDIITSIDIHREILRQYDYFGEGAAAWDAFAHRMWDETKDNLLTSSVELLQSNSDNIDRLLESYERVNVIDIGVGNGLPVKELLTHLLYDEEKLGRYIGLDISKEMLTIAEHNIADWLQGRVNFEGHIRDITFERFDDLLIDEDPQTTANLILLLGGTMNNFRSPDEVLKVIYHSMGRNSLLAVADKLDTDETRRYFDFNTEAGMPTIPLIFRFMLGHLNIDKSIYDAVQGYDNVQHCRFIGIKPKLDITIKFTIEDKDRFVTLYRGETILLWRYWHQSALDAINQLDRNNFTLVEASTTDDEQYLLTISKLRSGATSVNL